MNDIGKGDFVEAVQDIDDTGNGCGALIGGALYCIAEVNEGEGDCPDCPATTWVDLTDRPADPYTAWCVCTFRPIYRPKSEIIQSLLKPVEEMA